MLPKMLRKMLRKISVVSLFLLASVFSFAQAKSRHFELDYSFTVRITDSGQAARRVFPIAQSDQFQQVKIVSKSGDLPVKETSEPEYGNKLFYAHTRQSDKTEYHFSVKYDVVRLEHLAAVSAKPVPEKIWRVFFQADKLVPITGKPAEIAGNR